MSEINAPACDTVGCRKRPLSNSSSGEVSPSDDGGTLFGAADPQLHLTNMGVVGAPITSILMVDEDRLVYGQGPWMRFVRRGSKNSSTKECAKVLPGGCSIHGIAIVGVDPVNQDATTTSCGSSSFTLLVYGGRQLAIVTLAEQAPDESCNFHVDARQLVNDWIWTCGEYRPSHTEPNPQKHSRIHVGLAHNRIDVFDWCRTTTGQLVKCGSIQGSTRSITYSMAFCGDLVACGTVSNTVLVWSVLQSMEQQPQEHHLVGHKGAIHRVTFHSVALLASIAEDRTVRLWHYSDNNNAWSLCWTGWGHTSRGWNVCFAVDGRYILSTGEDGTLRVWESSTGKSHAVLRGHGGKESVWSLSCCGLVATTGGNDGSVASYNLCSVLGSTKLSETAFDKTLELDQGIFAMNYVSPGNKYFKEELTLLLGCRDGTIRSHCSRDATTKVEMRWRNEGREACSLSAHPTGAYVALGFKSGEIQVRSFQVTNQICTFDGTKYQAVQKLHWLDEYRFVSFHSTQCAVILWTISWDKSALKLEKRQDLVPQTNGLGISCASDRNRILLGDTRGNITLFDGSWQFSLRRVHGRAHVTQVIWDGKSSTISGGSDGKIIRCSVTAANELVKLVETPIWGFTGISLIHRRDSGELTIGGYHGTQFNVVDFVSGYEYISVDTGGRQRTLDLLMCDTNEENFCWSVAIRCAERSFRVCGSIQRGPTICSRFSKVISHPLHSETIFDAVFFSSGKQLCVVTGSEDCHTKICVVDVISNQSIKVHSKVRNSSALWLPVQTSPTRALHSLSLSEGLTLISIASKIEVHLYLVDRSAEVFFQGSATLSQKNLIDQRANCVTACRLRSDTKVLLFVGGSDGICYCATLDLEWGLRKNEVLNPAVQCERPILSLGVVSVDVSFLVMIGTSGGDARLCLVNQEGEFSCLLKFRPHQMGLNGISMTLSSANQPMTLTLITCGDDQAIGFANIGLGGTGKNLTAKILSRRKVETASLSALRGLCQLDDNHFATVGYAGKIALWSSLGNSIRKVEELQVSVGDVNCLTSTKVRDSHYVLCVGGIGMEFFGVSKLK